MPNPYEFVRYSLGKVGGGGGGGGGGEGGGGRANAWRNLHLEYWKHFYFITVYTEQIFIENCNSDTDVFFTVHRQRCQDLVV